MQQPVDFDKPEEPPFRDLLDDTDDIPSPPDRSNDIDPIEQARLLKEEEIAQNYRRMVYE